MRGMRGMGGMRGGRGFYPRGLRHGRMFPYRRMHMRHIWGRRPRLFWGIGCMLPIMGLFAMFAAMALLRAIIG